jgi:hypothetical protein
MKVFKIKNGIGLFSSGGYYPRWSKTGKRWTEARFVRLHLSLAKHHITTDWTIIEHDFDTGLITEIPVVDFLQKKTK